MLKAYKYRLYPNKEQKIQLAKTFGCCRFVYNQTLAHRKNTYEQEKRSLSKRVAQFITVFTQSTQSSPNYLEKVQMWGTHTFLF